MREIAADPPLRLARPRALAVLEEESFLVGLLAMLGLALVVVAPRTFVQDSWLTLVAGREVAEHGIPHREALTTIAHGRRWIDQQWLAQLVFFDAWRVGGLKLVAFVHAALLECAFALGVVAARRRGAGPRSTASMALLALVLAPWLLQLRAQSFALPLFAATYVLLVADSRRPSGRVLLVLPILALWANVHGSVVLGAALVELRALFAVFRDGRRPRAEAVRTLTLLVGAPLAVTASPYGFSLLHYYALMLVHAPFAPYITEWQPTGFGLLTESFFVVLLVTAVLVGRSPRRLDGFEQACLLVLAAAGLQAERNIVWFALAAVVSTPVLLDSVVLADPPPGRRARIVNLALAAAAVVLAVALAVAAPLGRAQRSGPVRVGDAVAALAVEDPGLRVLPTDASADWLLWRYPSLRGKVAYDVRFELLDGKELERLFRLRSDDDFRAPPARGYRVVLVDRPDPRASRALAAEGGRVVARTPGLAAVLLPARS